MAILALARIVRGFPDEWRRLQRLSTSDGRKLSDLCARACNKEDGRTAWQIAWKVEALATFQYMAETNDDDGNQISVLTEISVFGTTLLGRPVSATLITMIQESHHEDDMRTTRWAFQLIGNYGANMARSNRRPFSEDEQFENHYCLIVHQVIRLLFWYLAIPEDTRLRNMETMVHCAFAIANLAASRDRELKLLLSPVVQGMAEVLRKTIMGSHKFDENEEAMMDDICALTSKAIINIAGCDDSEMDRRLLSNSALALLKHARRQALNPFSEASLYALLALYSLVRKYPERKAMMADLGGADELRAWYSITSIHGGPWFDLVMAVIRTFTSDNPRMAGSPFSRAMQQLRAIMPRRPFQQILIEVEGALTSEKGDDHLPMYRFVV